MAKQVTVPFAGLSDGARSARMWGNLLKRFVSVSEAEDLDLTFSGAPADPMLGSESMSPIQDDDEEPMVSRSQQPNRAKTRPLARGAIRASTNRLPLAR